MKQIPIAEPILGKKELEKVTDCIKSTWISSSGKYILLFEKNFARFCGNKYAVSCTNGTVALHLALLALGIGKGDEVLVPNLTFVASANAVIHANATPILVDIEKNSWNMDPSQIEKNITPKTKAIIPVHLYGYPADMEKIMLIAKKHKLKVIEDAAEAHGAQIKIGGKWQYVGTIGDIGCFSFYGNKIITTGEGGMCITNKKQYINMIQLLKNHGMSPTQKYYHPILGFNYRMTNIQAAIGLAQLSRLKTFLSKREQIETWYRKSFTDFSHVILPPENSSHYQRVNWIFTLRILPSFGKKRNWLINYLSAHGIESRPMFYPLSHFPMYKTKKQFPVTEMISRQGLSLPSSPYLTKEEVHFIARTLKKAYLL